MQKFREMKSGKKYKLSTFMLFLAAFLQAQQNSLFNTYAMDPLQLNIAYAGAVCTEANLHYRTQWIGMKEAPNLIQLNAHTALGSSNGLALRVNSQRMGLLNNLAATAGYSYRFRVNENAKVHLGIGVGWSQASLLAQNSIVIDDDDQTLGSNAVQSANGFDSEFGAMYIGKKLKAGFSALHLYNSNPDFTGTNGFKILPQINTQFSYVFFKDQKVELEPWLLNRLTLKGDNVVEGVLKVNFLKSFTAGLGYRSGYGMIALLGAKISNFNLAYSFDYGVNKNAINLGTSHQIMLGFNFCRKAKPTEPKEEEPVIVTQPTVAAAPEVQVPKEEPVVVPKEEPVVTLPREAPVVKQESVTEQPEVKEAKSEPVIEPAPIQETVTPVVLQKILPEEINGIATGIVFSVSSYSISAENLNRIKEIAQILNKRSGNIVVVGYASTDGDKDRNAFLALHRAEVVKKALIKQGVAANRISMRNGGATDNVNANLEGNRTVRFE